MGWAQRARLAAPPPVPGDTPVFKALKARVLQIETLAQFEEMVLTADRPEQFRALVEPMLRPDLPCCARTWAEPHQKRCPLVLRAADHGPRPVILDPAGRVANA